jgi:hypothetical protein
MLKTEKEIRAKIKKVIEDHKHVLDCKLAGIFSNAPRALEQVSTTSQLNSLYWILGEKRPKFEYDKT